MLKEKDYTESYVQQLQKARDLWVQSNRPAPSLYGRKHSKHYLVCVHNNHLVYHIIITINIMQRDNQRIQNKSHIITHVLMGQSMVK